MAKQRLEARRQRSAKKVKASVRAKSKVAPKKAASRKLARKSAPTAVKKKPSARKPSQSLSTKAPAEVERAATIPTVPEPQAFWDPQGGQSNFIGDTKAHTKPENQREHIRRKAPRTWSNRQPGRG